MGNLLCFLANHREEEKLPAETQSVSQGRALQGQVQEGDAWGVAVRGSAQGSP